MNYLGLLILIYMAIGLLYGIFILFVAQEWDDIQSIKEETKSGQDGMELYDFVFAKKINFLIFCIVFGIPLWFVATKLRIADKKENEEDDE